MKPSKGFIWVLTIGITVVLLAIAFYIYREAKDDQAELLDAIATAQHTLEMMKQADTDDLQGQIVELRSQKSTADSRTSALESQLRRYTHTIEISEMLFDAATDTNVTITSIVAVDGEPAERNGVTYQVIPMMITGEAAVGPELINFSMKVTETLKAADYVAVEMVFPKPPESDDEEAEEELDPSTMDMQLWVYYLE